MSIQSRVSFGFGYGALAVAMMGYAVVEQPAIPEIISGWVDSSYKKQTKRKLKLVRKLTKEIVHVKEAQSSLEKDSAEYTSYLVHESLLNAKLMEFDEVLQRVNGIAEYQKTLQILNDIKQQMQMREEADMVFIMAIMMEECCG